MFVVFESVCPEIVRSALEYLMVANSLYSNVLIKTDNISDFLSLSDVEPLVEQDSMGRI